MLRNKLHKVLTTLTALAVMCVYSNIAFAQTGGMAEITVTGTVTVNGQPAVSGGTITTDSNITTGAGSGAVVNLGTRGKVELMADTALTLKFTDTSIVIMLTAGQIRVMNAPGVGATVTTPSATVVGDTGRANSFMVDLGCGDDANCADTLVETFSGYVTMTTNNDQNLKQIPAGAKASSGPLSDACNTACVRPGVLPIALNAGISTGLIAALLGGIGAATIAAILLSNTPVSTNGNVPVISPSA